MKITLAIAAFCLLIPTTHADMITDIENTLTADTSIPLAPGVALTLATNIWDAHEDTAYALAEADSLGLSLTAVLRAISLEAPALEIVDVEDQPLPFWQSRLAIDDRVSVLITPTAIDFGNVAVPTPEPSTLGLMGLGLLVVGMFVGRRRRCVIG